MWRGVVLPLGQGPGAALLPELLCSLLLAPSGVLPLPSSGNQGGLQTKRSLGGRKEQVPLWLRRQSPLSCPDSA